VSDLLLALTGIVVGALATGGLQILQAWRDRRLRARVAARLLTGELYVARVNLGRIAEEGRWPDKAALDFSPLVEVWTAHREAFAAGVDGVEWMNVASVCRHLVDLGAGIEPGERLHEQQISALSGLIADIDEAVLVTIERSHMRREAGRVLETLEERGHGR
jgi:hypothetical protein